MTDHAHEHPNYVKVWAVLVVLLLVSVVGPFVGITAVTLITAFGVALVKAYLVAKNFMHLNIERKYILYLLGTMLVFMTLFFSAVAPDVMKHDGDQWVKPGAEHWHLEAGADETAHH
ncbi:MAG: cytochrome C oxidase subunit IV family protein [Myxococcota bacterium]